MARPDADADAERDWRTAAARRFVAPGVLAVAAVALVLAADGAVEVVGWTLLGLALTVAVSLVFLEVGLSEDRERAREQARRRGRAGPPG